MPERRGPKVYSIAAHRGFADALAAGLLPRYAEPLFGLARLTLLLPSQRAARTVTEAFVRLAEGGLLLPRMVVVGDLDLDEALGALLDPLGAGAEVPPAADQTRRWLRLARHLATVEPDQAGRGSSLLRSARDIAGTMDRLLVEGIAPERLDLDEVAGIVGEQAEHWRASTATFLRVLAHWRAELDLRGEVDAPTRRNLLFERAARRWKEAPPPHPIVAAGVTSASPSLAKLLRVVADLPNGAVILPDLDLAMDRETWEALGVAGNPENREDPPIARGDAVTHPQYHLKLLLNRMGIGREEVTAWHRSGLAPAPPARSRAISNLFLPPAASARWEGLAPEDRRLSGVRLMESAHPGEEAQALAVLIREALERPERRVALVTPDRSLAARVVAHLERWDIRADDSAGRPLPQTPAGRVLLLLAEVMAERAAPVPLLALLTHPLVRAGEGRAAWLDSARALDLRLRGPRPAPGLEPLRPLAEKAKVAEWWAEAEAALAPLLSFGETAPLSDLLDALATAGEALCGERLWSEADGRSLGAFVEGLRDAAREAETLLDPRELYAVLRDAMDEVAVRPAWGGHPRLAIYGLLEARMARADLVLCGGLTEGVWPASPAPDPLLPPALLRALGVPGADFRIGLAAHDLSGALGAPEVVLSWARRDEGGPVIPSRFVLRIKAMLGKQADDLAEKEALQFARLIDFATASPRYPRPRPMPSAEQRLVEISATGLDRLRSDPYQFYASSILRLKQLDLLDAAPTPAWQGSAVHDILDAWHKAGQPAGELVETAHKVLDTMSAHPLMRFLWRPRLVKALEWIDEQIVRQREQDGRVVLDSEVWGDMQFKGVRIHARADRIDRLASGNLAIVDYKTGKPPSAKRVADGYSLQLGLIGLIATAGGFPEISGEPERFEYWSFGRDKNRADEHGFGYIEEPILEGRKKSGVPREEFVPRTQDFLTGALERWILGSDPFTARLNPDLPSYADYDQLMRLDEWLLKLTPEERNEA